MRVAPGRISPRRTAPMIIESAGRSFTETAGLLPSSFASRTLVVFPGMRCRRTKGVLPTNWSRVACMERARKKSPALGGASVLSEGGILLLPVVLLLVVLLLVGGGGLLRRCRLVRRRLPLGCRRLPFRRRRLVRRRLFLSRCFGSASPPLRVSRRPPGCRLSRARFFPSRWLCCRRLSL